MGFTRYFNNDEISKGDFDRLLNEVIRVGTQMNKDKQKIELMLAPNTIIVDTVPPTAESLMIHREGDKGSFCKTITRNSPYDDFVKTILEFCKKEFGFRVASDDDLDKDVLLGRVKVGTTRKLVGRKS